VTRTDDWIALLDDPSRTLQGHHPLDDVLGTLLVHLAFSDGVIQDDEIAFFARILPDRSRGEVLRWAERRVGRPVDLEALAPLSRTPGERRGLLGLAARVVGLDCAVATEEIVALHRLVEHLDLPGSAIREAIAEVVASGGPVAPDRVQAAVAGMTWHHLVPLPSADPALVVLGRSAGGAADVVVEREALWARFESGEARVRFDEIVSYTRLPVRGRAFHVRTDARDLTLAPPAFRDLGRLLDRIYDR